MNRSSHWHHFAFIIACMGWLGISPAQAQSIDDLPYTHKLNCNAEHNSPAVETICAQPKPKSYDDESNTLLGELLREDMFVVGLYRRALENTAPGGPEQAKIIAEQGAYLKRRDTCGQDARCILQVEQARHKELIALTHKLQRELPGEDIQSWTRGRVFPDGEGRLQALDQRLLQAFDQYPTPHVTLPDGSTVFWGFLTGAGQLQSLAITDARNHLQLLGTADGLLLASADPHKLQQARLAVFVRDPQALARYLPVVRAWGAADALGFNQKCPGQDQARCTAALQSPLPIQAYDLNCATKERGKIAVHRCPLPLPKVPDTVSPGLFWQ